MPNRMEQVMSKGAGKAKAVVAGMKGLRGVFNHLAEEHAEATSLLKRAKASKDASKQQDLWSKLRKELLSHERAELAEVYPALEAHQETREIAERHGQQAQQLETAISELDRIPYGTEAWKSQLESLEQVLKRHVDEEENHFFPAAQDALGSEVTQRMKPRFEEAKQAAMRAI